MEHGNITQTFRGNLCLRKWFVMTQENELLHSLVNYRYTFHHGMNVLLERKY